MCPLSFRHFLCEYRSFFERMPVVRWNDRRFMSRPGMEICLSLKSVVCLPSVEVDQGDRLLSAGPLNAVRNNWSVIHQVYRLQLHKYPPIDNQFQRYSVNRESINRYDHLFNAQQRQTKQTLGERYVRHKTDKFTSLLNRLSIVAVPRLPNEGHDAGSKNHSHSRYLQCTFAGVAWKHYFTSFHGMWFFDSCSSRLRSTRIHAQPGYLERIRL
jgi:hypothetical protein